MYTHRDTGRVRYPTSLHSKPSTKSHKEQHRHTHIGCMHFWYAIVPCTHTHWIHVIGMQLFHLLPPPPRRSGLRNTHTHTHTHIYTTSHGWSVFKNSLSGGRNGMARFPRDRDIHPPHSYCLAMSPTNLSHHISHHDCNKRPLPPV